MPKVFKEKYLKYECSLNSFMTVHQQINSMAGSEQTFISKKDEERGKVAAAWVTKAAIGMDRTQYQPNS